MLEKTISLDYKNEYKKLQEQMAKRECEFKAILDEKGNYYANKIAEKDMEIKWLKSVISGILHI